MQQASQFLVEQLCDELGRMLYDISPCVFDSNQIAVDDPLRNHQPVDAIGRKIFHVAIEQARASTAEHTMPVTDYGTNCRPRALYRARSNAGGNRPQVGIATGVLGTGLQLVWIRELRHRDLVLIRMTRPRPIHQTVSFVLFIFFQYGQRACVQFRVFTARIQRRHSADRKNPAMMTDLRHQFAQVLEEGHVVRNCVAIWKHPIRIVQIEVDQAGHVIPASQVQPDDVVAQVVRELFHLEGQRVRLHQCHAFDVVMRKAPPLRQRLEQISPPKRFFSRFRFRNIETQWVLQFRRINSVEDATNIEQRGRNHLPGNQASLAQVQAARTGEDHRCAGLNRRGAIAFLVVIRELSAQARQDIGHAGLVMRPLVDAGIL